MIADGGEHLTRAVDGAMSDAYARSSSERREDMLRGERASIHAPFSEQAFSDALLQWRFVDVLLRVPVRQEQDARLRHSSPPDRKDSQHQLERKPAHAQSQRHRLQD